MKTKVWKNLVLVSLFIVLFVFSAANSVRAVGVIATVQVGNAPTDVAYDSAKGEMFATNAQDNTTSVISDGTNTVVATIPVGGYPYGVAYDSALGEIFVVNLYSNSVSVISDSTNTVTANITVGASPYLIAYDSGTGEMYVTNSYDGTVSVISDSSNSVVATISVGAEPFGVAYDSGKNEVFVTFGGSGGANSVAVISDSTHTVVADISMPSYCQGLAYDSAKGEIFVPVSGNKVVVISDSSNTITKTIQMNTDDAQNVDAVYDSGRGTIFITDHQTDSITPISDSTNTAGDPIPNAGTLPWMAAYDPAKSEIFVADGGGKTVTVLGDSSSTSSSSAPTSSGSGSSSGFGFTWIIVIVVIIIVLVLIILLWMSRQRKLTVTVQNSQTLSPISGATVNVDGPENLAGTTNDNGQVVFKNPKQGDYKIKASAAGYTASMPVSISVKNKTQYTVKLDPNATKTQENAKPTEEPKGDSGTSAANITQPPQPPIMQVQQQNSAPVNAPTTVQESTQTSQQETFEQQGWSRERIRQNIKTFREKGALSPETAMTAKELGLSRMFVRYMEKRKGQTKVFKEINGKYYLDEKALDERNQM